jgi:uncharacterized membrane protein YgdD (TMEM256/DUF423 family)
MDRSENTVSNSSSMVACELIVLGTCLFCGRYLVMGLHTTILFTETYNIFSLPGGTAALYNIYFSPLLSKDMCV